MGHGLEVVKVEALGHEHVLAVAAEGVLDLEKLSLPLLYVVLPADLHHVWGDPWLVEELEGPMVVRKLRIFLLLVQLLRVDVQHRDYDVQLGVVDQVPRRVEESLVDLVGVLVLDGFEAGVGRVLLHEGRGLVHRRFSRSVEHL